MLGILLAGDFYAVFVVPFDEALDFFPILQNDHHRRFGLHLLEVVKIFGVCLLGGGRLAPGPRATMRRGRLGRAIDVVGVAVASSGV